MTSFASQLTGYFDALVGDTPATGAIAAAAAAPIAALAGAGDVPTGVSYGDGVAALFAAPSAAIAETSNPPLPAAIGPGDLATLPTATDARDTASLLLSIVPNVAVAGGTAWPGTALAVATLAFVAADIVSAASDIEYTSNQDAASWRDQVGAVLVTASDQAATAAGVWIGMAGPAGALWQSLADMQTAWAADMSATIGRLPTVVTLTLPAPTTAWLVAQYLSGDDPGQMIAVLQDLVVRNQLRRPWFTPATLEVLQP